MKLSIRISAEIGDVTIETMCWDSDSAPLGREGYLTVRHATLGVVGTKKVDVSALQSVGETIDCLLHAVNRMAKAVGEVNGDARSLYLSYHPMATEYHVSGTPDKPLDTEVLHSLIHEHFTAHGIPVLTDLTATALRVTLLREDASTLQHASEWRDACNALGYIVMT